MSSPEKEEYLVIEKGAAGDESSSRLGQRVVGEQVVVNEDGSRTVIRTVEETFEEEVEELRTESFTERNEIEDADSGIENATPAKSARVTKKDSIKEYVAKKMVENHSTNEPPQSRQQHPSPIIGRTGKLYKRKRKEPCPYCEYTRQVLTMMGHDMDETEKLVLNVGKVKECLVQELANIEERQRLLKERIVYEERIRRQRRLQEQYQKLKKLKKRKRRRHMKPVEQPSPKKAVAIAMRVGPEQTENKQVGLYRLYKPPMPMTARPSKREESHPVHHELDVSKPHGPKCRSHHHTDLYPEDDGRYHCHGDVRIHRGDMYYTIPSKDLLFRSYAQEKEVDPVTIERIIDKIPQIRKQQGDHVIVLDEDILTFGNWEEIKSEVIIPHHVLRMDEAPAVPVEREGRVSPITLEMGTWDEVLNDVFHIAIDKEQVSRQPRYLQGQNLNAWASVEETDEVPRLQYQAAQINVVEQEVFNPQTEEIEVEEAEYLNGVLRSIYTNLEQVNGEFPGYCDSCAHAKLHEVMQEVFEAEMSQVVFEEPKYLEVEEGKAHVKLEEAKEELPPLPFHMLAYGQAVMDMYRPNAKKVRSESPRYLHSVEDLEFLHEEDFHEDCDRIELERLMGEQVKQVLWEHSTGGLRSSGPEYLKALVSEGYVTEEGEDGRISPTPSLQSLVIGETLMDIFRAEAGAVDTEDPRYHQGIVSREYAAEEEIDGILTQENFDKAAIFQKNPLENFSPVSFENALLGQVFVDQWKADLQTIEAETARYHHGIIQHGIVSGESIDGKVSPPPNPQNVVVGQALMDIFKANVEEVPLERPRYHATENELQQESTGKISPLSFESPDFGEVFMKKWKAVMKQEEVRVPRYHHGILSDEYMGDEAIDGRISPRPTAQNLLVAQVLMETFKATSEQVRAEIPRYIAKEDQMSHNEESTGKVSPVSFESATLGEIFMERWRTNIDLVKASSPRYHHAVIGEEYLGREEADGRLSPQPTFKNLLSAQVLMETFRATSDKVRAEVPQHFAREGQTSSVDSTGTVSPVSFENATFGEICMEKVKAITKEEKAELPRYHHAFISDEFVGEEEIDGRISPRRTAENLLAAQVLMETFRATSEKVKAEVPRYTAREGHTSNREESTGTISPVSFESAALGEVFMEKWRTNLDEVKAQSPRYHHGYVMDEFVGEEEIDGRISPLPNVEKLLTAQVLLEAHKATSERVRQEVPDTLPQKVRHPRT
ncbi:Hypp9614 [Branchiostoma lanceolatum]|uniref:Hypp9614 protein n=1 Tax=Branchiostoma lanceolatum TaxID=7740 RepID=A0A8S4MP20_BRALA|nr:Hypp9614 [Branchiostoma lanceolatum]